MAPTSISIVLTPFIILWTLCSVDAKVFMVLLDAKDSVSYECIRNNIKNDNQIKAYKEKITSMHDSFLAQLLPVGSYSKLYSYTRLLNGFAIHASSDEVLKILRNASGVHTIQEDVRVSKFTTHTPEFLDLPNKVWPQLDGAVESGKGVVIGIIDTGINPSHPSFVGNITLAGGRGGLGNGSEFSNSRFRGVCEVDREFRPIPCNRKIVGARHFLHAATAEDGFNDTRHPISPFDEDGHGSHAASIAAGNHQTPIVVNGSNFGNASGMAPGAGIAVYKAMTARGGYMSDVVAAVDQAAEDGVDILSLSFGPAAGVPRGASTYLGILETQLLFAARAGVFVVQAVGNGGPSAGSILSFSPWIMSVAASTTDRRYNNSVVLGNRRSFAGIGISPPTGSRPLYLLAAAADVSVSNASMNSNQDCLRRELFIRSLARGKIIICTLQFDEVDEAENELSLLHRIAGNIRSVKAVGFVLTADPNVGSYRFKGTTLTLPVPGIVLSDKQSSRAMWDYYNGNTYRKADGAMRFRARAKISDGRRAIFTESAPAVAEYSSRGPDVDDYHMMQAADVLKPNVLAPGSSIWAAWSPPSRGNDYLKGQSFALLSGTSVAAPHVAGIAALVKQKHPTWSPAAIASAMMTTARSTERSGGPILAHGHGGPSNTSIATPLDLGSGFVNASRALDPGLIFDASFDHYVRFLCAVPRSDPESVHNAVGVRCPNIGMQWGSDLNLPSVTVASLVGLRQVERRVTNVAGKSETYLVIVREPAGVNVTVVPRVFTVVPGASRKVRITLAAAEARREFAFGEVVMLGDRNHEVRVPLAVYVSSAWKP